MQKLKKNSRKRRMFMSVGMAWILVCNTPGSVCASEIFTDQPIYSDEIEEVLFQEDAEENEIIFEESENEFEELEEIFTDDVMEVELFTAGEDYDEIALFSEASFAETGKVTFARNFNDSILPAVPGSGADQWQIMQGTYVGRYDGSSDVSNGFDQVANVSYSSDDAIRMTKNVISTDTENEFLMYLNIEPQISWEEILQLNTIVVANNNKPVSPPDWPEKAHVSYLKPEKDSIYTVPIQVEYYAMENGKKITIAKVTMYANTQNVPKGSYGVGNPLFDTSGGTFCAGRDFNIKENGNSGVSTVEIDITELYAKYDFSMQKVHPKQVVDQMGKHIKVNSTSFNYDGGSLSEQNGILNWNLPADDLGVLPYHTEIEDGLEKIVPSGVKRSLSNGKVTFYRQEAYQLSYQFSLTVEDENFVSCGSVSSVNDCTAQYAVQTNISPDTPENKEHGGWVTYTVNGQSGTGYLKSPYIKGLLYDLEFQKVLENSMLPLEGVTFSIEKADGTGGILQQTTGSDGWMRFCDLPWGEYIIKEISYQEGNYFQSTYLKQELPKTLGSIWIGQVVNGSALINDHQGLHSCDRRGELRNRLFVFEEGTVGNEPYRARITVKKVIHAYDTLPEEIKSALFNVKMDSDDIYLKPEEDAVTAAFLHKEDTIGHMETLVYEMVVPKNGGTLTLEEIIPEVYKNKFVFGSIDVQVNAGSTETGSYGEIEQGCRVTVMPENDITITITNIPVGKIYIKKEIDNYSQELSRDTFIIQAISGSDAGSKVNTQVVLKNGQISAPILITEEVALDITEIVPKEYSISEIVLSGGGKINGTRVTVKPGEEVTVTVRNHYEAKSFFHVFDAITNIFQSSKA